MRRPGLAYIEIRLPQEVATRIDAAVKLSPGISTRTGWLVALIHRELASLEAASVPSLTSQN